MEELHGMGYLIAAEQLALTPPADVSVVSPDAGFEARSWVSFWRDDSNPRRKWSYCGTVTKRPYPGQLFLDGDYKEYRNGQLYATHPWPPKSSQLGDSLISAFRKTYINSEILHVVKGEHAFALPPEALIHTYAEGTY